MFERYTEKARRVVFFSRYEASQFGSPYIETEHLLLGLFREDKSVFFRYLTATQMAEIRREIELRTVIREKVSTSVDLPLSNESKRVLAYAAEEAERAGHAHIGTEHLFAGLLREEDCFAATLLKAHGVSLESVRTDIKTGPPNAAPGGGVGGGGGRAYRKPPRLDFVCGTEKLTSAAYYGQPPRVGEHVILGDGGKQYRVRDVVYTYELPPAENKEAAEAAEQVDSVQQWTAPALPIRIVIQLEEE